VSNNIVHKQGLERPARKAYWDAILEEEMVIIGDLNAYSPKWNVAGDGRRRDYHFLEELIENHGLILKNDGLVTRRPDWGGQNTLLGVINIILMTLRIAHRVIEWKS
jgi:hypothetical protein